MLVAILFLIMALPAKATNDLSPPSNYAIQNDCQNLSLITQSYQANFLNKMTLWSNEHLAKINDQTVFYPFSGPDVVTPLSLFSKANYFVMVADQIPDYDDVKQPKSLNTPSSSFECQILEKFATRGFYFTQDLIGRNSPRPRFIKLLLHSIEFAGARVVTMHHLTIHADGKILPAILGEKFNGVRFELVRANGTLATVDYINANISNAGLAANPNFVKAFERKASQVVFIKSASHLLQATNFSTLREILVKKSSYLIQDETGLDIIPFAENFDIQLYGKFLSPNPIWSSSASGKRLAQFYTKHSTRQELPFQIGYKKEGGSMLLLGTKKSAIMAMKSVP